MQNFRFTGLAEYDTAIASELTKQKEEQKALDKLKENRDNDEQLINLRKQLKALEETYESQEMEYLGRIGNFRITREELERERVNFTRHQNTIIAEERGHHDTTTVKDTLLFQGIIDPADTLTLKKTLSNGINVFKVKSEILEHYTKLFLYKGASLVGYWCKRKPLHPGDDVQARGWIGVSQLRDDEMVDYSLRKPRGVRNDVERVEDIKIGWYVNNDYTEAEKSIQHPFYRKSKSSYYGRTDVTMPQFMKYVENITDELPEIDITDKITIDILIREPIY